VVVSRYRTAGLFLGLGVVWGTAFVAIKAGLAYFPPVLFAALRYDVAGLLMLGYAAVVLEDPVPRGRQWLLVVVGSVLMIAAYHAFLFVGEQGTTSGAAAVIVSLMPVLTAGFARLFLPEERLAPAGVAGLLLGLVGVVIVARPDGAVLSGSALSELLVFAATLSFALGSVLSRWIDAELPPEGMEAWSMVGGALLMHVVSAAIGESPAAVVVTAEAVLALAYLAVVASAVGFLFYFELLDRLGPTEINLVSYVVPVFAALVGWLYLGERVDAATAVGFLAILAGFALLKRRSLRAELLALGVGDDGPQESRR
jgi:drug/metabolite transporter (DMT)-like permease